MKKDSGKIIDQEIKHGNHIDAGFITVKQVEHVIKNMEKTMLEELDRGYNLIKQYPRSVSILGSARFNKESKYYKHADKLAHRIVTELKYTVVTGGGPGIMEAANKGAFDAGGASIGFTIELPKEQHTNKYVTASADFNYFFSRKMLLFFSAETYIFYPGGFGTFDELFTMVASIQTKKIEPVPIILVGTEYWQPLLDVIKQKLLTENNTIDAKDMDIFTLTDSEDEIITIIKDAPYRQA